jgi:hypothetical protein
MFNKVISVIDLDKPDTESSFDYDIAVLDFFMAIDTEKPTPQQKETWRSIQSQHSPEEYPLTIAQHLSTTGSLVGSAMLSLSSASITNIQYQTASYTSKHPEVSSRSLSSAISSILSIRCYMFLYNLGSFNACAAAGYISLLPHLPHPRSHFNAFNLSVRERRPHTAAWLLDNIPPYEHIGPDSKCTDLAVQTACFPLLETLSRTIVYHYKNIDGRAITWPDTVIGKDAGRLVVTAAELGNLDVVRFICENAEKDKWMPHIFHVMESAIKHGNWDILWYFSEHNLISQDELDSCFHELFRNHKEHEPALLNWLLASVTQISSLTCFLILKAGTADSLKLILPQIESHIISSDQRKEDLAFFSHLLLNYHFQKFYILLELYQRLGFVPLKLDVDSFFSFMHKLNIIRDDFPIEFPKILDLFRNGTLIAECWETTLDDDFSFDEDLEEIPFNKIETALASKPEFI